MGINNSQIAEGATMIASGGTAKTFTSTGLKVPNGIQVADASVTTVTTRPTMTFTSTPETYDSKTKTWNRSRRDISSVRPKVLTSGAQEFPSVRVKASLHPEMTIAEITALRLQTAQAIMDSEYDSFWNSGSTA